MSEAHTLPENGDPGTLDEGAGRLLAAMYARRGRALYGLCRMMLRDAHEAEDALQSTFLSAHRALIAGTRPRDEAAWLSTIARNECRGRIRERMRRPVSADAVELDAVVDPARRADEVVADATIGKALAALPVSQREAVVLHDVYGLRAREVGAALGLSIPAVEAVIFRARRQLRARLRPAGASALALPLGVQEALTAQVPGFASGAAGGTAVTAGLLAKALATPTAVKLAAGAAAIVTTGSVVAVERTRPPGPLAQQAGIPASQPSAPGRSVRVQTTKSSSGPATGPAIGRSAPETGAPSGPRGATGASDHSGASGGSHGDDANGASSGLSTGDVDGSGGSDHGGTTSGPGPGTAPEPDDDTPVAVPGASAPTAPGGDDGGSSSPSSGPGSGVAPDDKAEGGSSGSSGPGGGSEPTETGAEPTEGSGSEGKSGSGSSETPAQPEASSSGSTKSGSSGSGSGSSGGGSGTGHDDG